MTRRSGNGVAEPKADYLRRIMESGSTKARLLKLADRISNLISLGFVSDYDFVERYLAETRLHILPYAEGINGDMARELADLVDDRQRLLAAWRNDPRLPLRCA